MNIHVSIVTMVLSATVIVIVTNTEHATLPITLGSLQPIQLLLVACLLLAGLAGVYMKNRPRSIYLIDYACYYAGPTCRFPISSFIEHCKLMPSFFDDRGIQFVERTLHRSGIGDETSLPLAVRYIPPSSSLDDARAEAELVIFSAIDDLLAKTGIAPSTIDILVVNCSVFLPVPSLGDMILNRYKLRDDIHNVTLSGMGCSAGLISVGLARDLLRVRPAAQHGAHALVVSTETITPNIYKGKNTSMQVTNIIFRMGGAAVLLSTSKSMARFRLAHLVRTNTCADDSSYHCILHEEDVDGTLGINISKNILAAAANALKANFTAIGPLVLPLSVQLFYKLFLIMRKYSNGRVKQYHPDFRKAVQHWCIHPGARPVIDKVQHNLGLSDEQMEPSRMTLHRFGNMSSSTIWYELAYIEAKSRMRKGDRVWMLGFGSGFKSNSAVWDCIRPAEEVDKAWAGCIHRYPVAAPTEALNSV